MTLWTTLKAQLDATGVDGSLARAARHLIAHGPSTFRMEQAGANFAAESKAQIDVLYAIKTYLDNHEPKLKPPTGNIRVRKERAEAFRREHATCTDEVCIAWRQPQQPNEGLNL